MGPVPMDRFIMLNEAYVHFPDHLRIVISVLIRQTKCHDSQLPTAIELGKSILQLLPCSSTGRQLPNTRIFQMISLQQKNPTTCCIHIALMWTGNGGERPPPSLRAHLRGRGKLSTNFRKCKSNRIIESLRFSEREENHSVVLFWKMLRWCTVTMHEIPPQGGAVPPTMLFHLNAWLPFERMHSFGHVTRG